ncbi:hypothetical protein fugu_011899 [Takifugu bimaculatus]|uniref:UPAR/Ly6 domain-containing protein n=1 Tax=Takifugu bimaculatus TaxID=433685 RepID=A0A4Z2C8U2_9TELE|nr:hypothetical protein fugu_011899 [Takifugu bimaculatus]
MKSGLGLFLLVCLGVFRAGLGLRCYNCSDNTGRCENVQECTYEDSCISLSEGDVPVHLQIQVPMLQQQPVQLRQWRYHGDACPGSGQLAAEHLVVLELNGAEALALSQLFCFQTHSFCQQT